MKSNVTANTSFPMAIPTRVSSPTARLVLRGNNGLVVKHWLIKQAKCTLGSSPECAIQCDLPGIAPYHVLIVLGARQAFLRALAPKLSRDGVQLNELLLAESKNVFEIAGHTFELTRQPASNEAALPPSRNDRMKFAVSRPLDSRAPQQSSASAQPGATTQEHAAVSPAVSPSVVSSDQEPERLDVNADTATPRWVARIVRDAILPLENQLRDAIEPIERLQAEVRREKRKRIELEEAAKLQIAKAQEVVQEAAAQKSSDEQSINAEEVDRLVREQIESLAARQNSSMEVVTERISDVNQQLSTIERIVLAEQDREPKSGTEQIAAEIEVQSASIAKLSEGLTAVTAAITALQQSQHEVAGNDLQWRESVQSKLEALEDAVDSLHSQSTSAANQFSELDRATYEQQLLTAPTSLDVQHVDDEDFGGSVGIEVCSNWSVDDLSPESTPSFFAGGSIDDDFVQKLSQGVVNRQPQPAANSDEHGEASEVVEILNVEASQLSPSDLAGLDVLGNQNAELLAVATQDEEEADEQVSLEPVGFDAPSQSQSLPESQSVVAEHLDASVNVDQAPDENEAVGRNADQSTDESTPPAWATQPLVSEQAAQAGEEEEFETGMGLTPETESESAPNADPFAINTDSTDFPETERPKDEFDRISEDFTGLDNEALQGDEAAPADSESVGDEDGVSESVGALPEWWNDSEPTDTAASKNEADGFVGEGGRNSEGNSGPKPDSEGFDQEFAPAVGAGQPQAGEAVGGSAWAEGNSPWQTEQPSASDQGTADPNAAGGDPQSSELFEMTDSVQVAEETPPQPAVPSPAAAEDAWQQAEGDAPAKISDTAQRLEAGIRDSEAFMTGDNAVQPSDDGADAFGEQDGPAGNNQAENAGKSVRDTGSAAFSLLDSVEAAATEASGDQDATDGPSPERSSVFLQVPEKVVAPEEAAEVVAPERQILPGDRLDDSFPTMRSMTGAETPDPFDFQNKEPQQNSLLGAFGIDGEAEAEPKQSSHLLDEAMQSDSPGSKPVEPNSGAVGPASSAGQDEPAEEEESVEAYMERLLARMRGEGADEPPADVAIDKPAAIIQEAESSHLRPAPEPAREEPAPEEMAREEMSTQEPEADAFGGVGEPTSKRDDQQLASEPAVSNSTDQELFAGIPAAAAQSPQPQSQTPSDDAFNDAGLTPQQAAVLQAKEAESRQPRSPSPEQSAQISAMRELANTNARTAIVKSNRNRVLSSFLFKAGISLVGFVVAGALIAINGLSVNIGLVATIAALLVGAIWGWDAFTTLVSFSRLKSSDKQAEAAPAKGAEASNE